MLGRMLAGLLPLPWRSAASCHRRAAAARERGEWARAADWYRRVLARRPGNADAHNDLGIVLCALKDFAGARQAFTEALALRGEFVEARLNLAQLLRAELCDYRQAAAHYRAALALQPANADAQNDLGIALCALRDFTGARLAFTEALALRGEFVQAHMNLGQLLQSQFRDFRQAASHYQAVLALDPAQAQARNNLALTLYQRGLVEQAMEYLRDALQRSPDDELALEFMLFMSNALPQRDLAQWHAEHRRWGQRHADPLPRYAHAPAGAARRLRIGYVSADLREHATASFVRPVLAHHDADAFEIFCYSNSDEVDATTQNMQRLARHWRAINGIDDARAAAMIHGDAIDILVDLSGHTLGHRLGLFARKPAPVQISYLGYLNTAGMETIDYRITDARADPPGVSDRLHCETLLRMPQTLWCYEPPQNAPAVALPPVQRNGHITFGSFNHVAKLNDGVLSIWAELLRRLPDARLQVMAVPDEDVGARICATMLRYGIEGARVRTLPRVARGQYWQALGEVDIALDPFPYTGGATTCDSLWIGLPVVTLAGSFGFARSSASILFNAGLGELVAADAQEYIDVALRLACDVPRLAELREGMRGRLSRSPLLDAPRFVQALEQLYREVWRKAVSQRQMSC